MNKFDVSVVLNLHREAPYLRATLLSLDACAQVARKAGLRCELVAVLDRSDEPTRHVFTAFSSSGFVSQKVIEVDFGSLGLSRNAGVDAAEGEFVWTADGDDLVSKNSLVELHKTATRSPNPRCAVFINYLIAFGEQFHIGKYFNGEMLTVADFVYQHPYVSRIFLRRIVFEHVWYSDLRVSSGYAYEDWEFNARLRGLGFDFLVAPNTLFFYRQRPGSLLRLANNASARMIPQLPLFEPTWYINELAQEQKRIGDWRLFVQRRQQTSLENYAHEVTNNPALREHLIEACRLDPEVDPIQIEKAETYSPVPWHGDHWGYRLADAFKLAAATEFTDVVLLPWLIAGGAEKYILQILHEIAEADPKSKFLVLCGEPAPSHPWANRLPENSVLIDIYNAFPTLNDQDRDKMTARLLLAVTLPQSRLHIKPSIFSHRLFNTVSGVLLQHFKVIYYRFCDERYTWQGQHLSSFKTLTFLRTHLPGISTVVSDCRHIVNQDKHRLGLDEDKYQTIYCRTDLPSLSDIRRAPTHRLLWASRITEQKRPSLLPILISQLRQRIPDVELHVYGQAGEVQNIKQLFQQAGLVYKGAYEEWDTIPVDQFDAFIYTTAFDGLPNVVLEAMASGVPVIAPNIGGIGEVIIDGQTGLLVDDETNDALLIDSYCTAIEKLYINWELRNDLAMAGRRLIEDQHSKNLFSSQVRAVYQLKAFSE